MTIALAKVADGREIARTWLDRFAEGLLAENGDAIAALFKSDGHWRDILALTWDLRTFSGAERAGAGLVAAARARAPRRFLLETTKPQMFERKGIGPTIETFFRFETDIAKCRGHLRLVPTADGGSWQAWTLFTAMEDLIGFEEKAGERRPPATGADHGGTGRRYSALDHAQSYETTEPDVVVVGGAQAGLTLAARLGQLDVPTLVIEREAHVGDSWRKRYQSLVLHNQIWANHLPYLEFPASWPVYISKDQLADWLEFYASVLSLAVWTSTQIVNASYDDDAGRWTLTLRRGDGSEKTLHPRHVVLATGVFGIPNTLAIPGSDQFNGRIMSATDYRGGEDVAGVRALVIGAGSSAHDVAQDLHRNGAQVTMLQRSTTCVISVDPGAARFYSIYSEHGAPIEDCDMIGNSFPFPLVAELHKDLTKRIAELDSELLAGLRDAGFALDFGDDGSGFLMKYHRTGGGYYINVGTSDLIIKGEIKIKQGVEIKRAEASTVYFTDGSSLDADIIVVATGYQNMQTSVQKIFGDEVAKRVGPVWGFDAEGELRAIWKRTGQRGFWLAGGSLQQCRAFSKYLALQLKGDQVGLLK